MKVRASNAAVIGLVGFLYVSFVGLLPFAPRGADAAELARESSVVSQILSITFALLALGASAYTKPLAPARFISAVQLMALAWAAASIAWSPEPYVSAKRLALTVLTVVVASSAVASLGPWRALRVCAVFLGILVVASIAAGMLIDEAVHQASDPEPAIVGAWRGVFFHKNTAGFAAAVSLVMAFAFSIRERSNAWILVAAASLMLLLLTRSKTSISLLLPAAAAAGLFAYADVKRRSRAAVIAIPALVVAVVVAISVRSEEIGRALENPELLTGRAAIWATLWQVIADHPLTGVGYGALYGDSASSVFPRYAQAWVSSARHGHNGYLDLIASVGWWGALLAIAGFLLQPIFWLLRSRLDPMGLWVCATMLVFLALHNGLESSLMDRNRPEWLVLAIVIAVLRSITLHGSGKGHVDRSSPVE